MPWGVGNWETNSSLGKRKQPVPSVPTPTQADCKSPLTSLDEKRGGLCTVSCSLARLPAPGHPG